MKQFPLFLAVIVLADFTFGLPVTKVEEKKDEKEDEKHEELGNDIEVKTTTNTPNVYLQSFLVYCES